MKCSLYLWKEGVNECEAALPPSPALRTGVQSGSVGKEEGHDLVVSPVLQFSSRGGVSIRNYPTDRRHRFGERLGWGVCS